MKVAIIIPVIRPDKASRCIEAITKNAGYSNYIVIAEEDKGRIGCPKMVKKLVDKAPKDVDAFCFLGDDTIPQPDFLKNAIDAMNAIPGKVGLVNFNDNPTAPMSRSHWLAHKDLLPMLDGEFFHTGYSHSFCDDELWMRCAEVGKTMYAYNAVLIHDHPIFREHNPETDQDYENVYANERYEKDEKLFNERRASKWGKVVKIHKEPKQEKIPVIAICIPSMSLVHAKFAVSLANMVAVTSSKVTCRIVIIQHSTSLLPVSRCELVEMALSEQIKADKILFLDSDMQFPSTTLISLLSHQKEVVCTDAARRKEPIENVVRDANGNYLDHTKQLDPCVELSGLSTAILLIDSKVFKNMQRPYFEVKMQPDGISFLGEDYYFGNKLKELGYKIYCDTALTKKIGHIGDKTYFVEK